MRSMMVVCVVLWAAIAALTGCSHMQTDAPETSKRLVLAEQGYFFVGGRYSKTSDGEIRVGNGYKTDRFAGQNVLPTYLT